MALQVDASAAVRDLASALVAHEVDAPTLNQVAAAARALADRLRGEPKRDRLGRLQALEAEDDPEPGVLPRIAERPIGGPANPTAVPTTVRRDPDHGVIAKVVFDPVFEGGVGRVHGGVIAGMFDDVTGHVTTLLRVPAVTGRLSVAFRRPVPVGARIVFRAWVTEQHGRRIRISAECRDGDVVLATADALYVVVGDDRRNQL